MPECDRQADVLRFSTNLQIPPTSNQAERHLRPARPSRNIRPAPQRAGHPRPLSHRRREYIETARKHGAHVRTVIRDALTGNPWMPPIPSRRKPAPRQLPRSARPANSAHADHQ